MKDKEKIMKYKITKYGLLIVLGIIAVYQIFPIRIGDYCEGVINGIAFMFFGSLFLCCFLIFLLIDLVRTMKKKIKFDYIPCVFLCVFIAINLLSFQFKNDKFWTETILIGNVVLDEDLFSNEQLILYKNKTFSIKTQYIASNCTRQGKYSIKQDTLILKRNDLSKLTDNLFCTKYLIRQTDSTLIPIEKGYNIINFK